jgi:hypothetical protein
MPDIVLDRPGNGENGPYYDKYIGLVPAGNLVSIMESQIGELDALLRPLSRDGAGIRYADGKWSVRQVVGHLIDSERVFSFRAIAFACGEPAHLPSFDQELWVANAGYDERELPALLDEFAAARRASLAMVRGLSEAALTRRGIASELELSVRAALCILPGHVSYHIEQLRRLYLSA